MLKNFIVKNLITVTILIFLIMFILLIINKPKFIFKKNGQPRDFGIGYKNKTILPIWLAVIIISIISYLIVLYYINFNKFIF